jgi:hypothetical protein
VWTVRFYNNGVATYLTVDNELPETNGYLDFADMGQSVSSSSNILWVPLAEKAYAQLCADGWNQRPQSNSYASLDDGNASTALPVITGHAESGTNSVSSSTSLINALASGTLITLGSFANVPALGIVGDHDYAVLGYTSSNQTFTLLNPWGWNTHFGYDGYTAAGMLHLTWSQLSQYYFLDGNCNPFHTAAPTSESPLSSGSAAVGAATISPSSVSNEGVDNTPVDSVQSFCELGTLQQLEATLQANGVAANFQQSSPVSGTSADTASTSGYILGST